MILRFSTVLFAAVICACSQTGVRGGDSPGANDDRYSVKPGSDLLLDVTLQGGAVEWTPAPAGAESASLTFSMSEMGERGVMMSVKSEVERPVKYDLYMIDYQGKAHYTSSCPVMPGSGVFESWGHQIPEIVVTNIRVLDESAEMVCK